MWKSFVVAAAPDLVPLLLRAQRHGFTLEQLGTSQLMAFLEEDSSLADE